MQFKCNCIKTHRRRYEGYHPESTQEFDNNNFQKFYRSFSQSLNTMGWRNNADPVIENKLYIGKYVYFNLSCICGEIITNSFFSQSFDRDDSAIFDREAYHSHNLGLQRADPSRQPCLGIYHTPYSG